MIRTKQPQVINAKKRLSEVVYMQAGNRTNNSVSQTVSIDIKMARIVPIRKEQLFAVLDENGQPVNIPVLDANGNPVMVPARDSYQRIIEDENGNPTLIPQTTKQTELGVMIHPKLEIFRTEKALFKLSTFEALFGSLKESEYDPVLIQQIAYVNSKEWTGDEIMQTYYWNLGETDLEIVDKSELQQLLTPYREE